MNLVVLLIDDHVAGVSGHNRSMVRADVMNSV